MNRRSMMTAVMLGLIMLNGAAHADQADRVTATRTAGHNTPAATTTSPKKLGLNEGIVEQVDQENRSILLKHGRIHSNSIDMGPMTMPFNVSKASLLTAVKAGDRIKFHADNINGMPTLTAIKVQR